MVWSNLILAGSVTIKHYLIVENDLYYTVIIQYLHTYHSLPYPLSIPLWSIPSFINILHYLIKSWKEQTMSILYLLKREMQMSLLILTHFFQVFLLSFASLLLVFLSSAIANKSFLLWFNWLRKISLLWFCRARSQCASEWQRSHWCVLQTSGTCCRMERNRQSFGILWGRNGQHSKQSIAPGKGPKQLSW